MEMPHYDNTYGKYKPGGTPDNVTHTGTRVLIQNNGDSKSITPNNIHDNNAYMTGSLRNQVYMNLMNEPNPNVVLPGMENQDDHRSKVKLSKEDDKCMAHKYLLCLLLMVVILGAIVAVLIKFKSHKTPLDLGYEVPDPINYDECESVSLGIGKMLNFTCEFNTLHEYRKHLIDIDGISVFDQRGVYVPVAATYRADGSTRILSVRQAPNVLCSDEGRFQIKMWKNGTTDLLLHTAVVRVSIKPSTVKTELQQLVVASDPRIGCSDETLFNFTCSISNDCNNYAVDFTGRKDGREQSFKYKMGCSSSFTDQTGFTTQCGIQFTETEIEDFAYLGCKFTSPKRYTRKLVELPDCNYYENCTSTFSRWYFNCTKNSTELQSVNAGMCSDLTSLTRCFSPGRMIHEYEKGAYYDNEWDCEGPTVPACRLSWCKRGQITNKNESPAEILCPKFEEDSVNG